MNRAKAARLLVVFSLVTIAGLTLYPDSSTTTSNWNCIFCGTRATADLVLNILLFAPLGAGFGMLRIRAKNALILAVMLSGAVEVAQLVIPGRDASISDLISNAAGCWLGYALTLTAPYWIAARDPLDRRLSLAASIVAAIAIVVTGTMLQPTFTEQTYYGQWTPDLGHLDWYHGQVLEATVGSSQVPSQRLEDSDTIRTLLRTGSPIHIRAVASQTTRRLSSLFSIADADENMIVLIGPRMDRLFYIFRVRAESFRLDRPALSIPDVMDLSPGDTIEINVSRIAREYCVVVNQNTHCGLGFTAGSGWTLWWYSETLPQELHRILNMVWLCVLLLPFGLWMRLNLESMFGATIVASTLLWAPALTGLSDTPLSEWMGSAAGVVAGISLGVLARRFFGNGERRARSGKRSGQTQQITFRQQG